MTFADTCYWRCFDIACTFYSKLRVTWVWSEGLEDDLFRATEQNFMREYVRNVGDLLHHFSYTFSSCKELVLDIAEIKIYRDRVRYVLTPPVPHAVLFGYSQPDTVFFEKGDENDD